MKDFTEPEIEVLNFDIENYALLEEDTSGGLNNMGWA